MALTVGFPMAANKGPVFAFQPYGVACCRHFAQQRLSGLHQGRCAQTGMGIPLGLRGLRMVST